MEETRVVERPGGILFPLSLSSQWFPIWSLVYLMLTAEQKKKRTQRNFRSYTSTSEQTSPMIDVFTLNFMSVETLFCGERTLYDDQRV